MLGSVVACATFAQSAEAALDLEPTELLSLQVPLKPGEYVEAFKIDTQGVEIIAVCHIPFGWKTTAGIGDSIIGELSGQAGLGPSFVSPGNHNSRELLKMFLVRVSRYTTARHGGVPPTFQATATIGRYGSAAESPPVRLTPSDIIRTRAKRCPPPNDSAGRP